MKNALKRGFIAFVALTMCLTAFVGLGGAPARAAGEQVEVYLRTYPRETDENQDGVWGHPPLQFMNGWKTSQTEHTTIRAMGSYTGEIAYCIEPGIGQHTGDAFTKRDENFWDNYPADYNRTIQPDNIKLLIGRILQYGYVGPMSSSWVSQDESGDTLAYAMATQLLVWETIVGERDEDFAKVSTGGYDPILNMVTQEHPVYERMMRHYRSIEASVQRHTKLPSFMRKTAGNALVAELEWDGSQYIATLTDEYGVLGNYQFDAPEGVDLKVQENKLTVIAKVAPKDAVTVTASKEAARRGVITWTDGSPREGSQDVVTYGQQVSDPVKGFVKLQVSYGSAKIVKESEDGVVAGVGFVIQGNGVEQTVETGEHGEIQIDHLEPGEYTITELAQESYVPQPPQTVTVKPGETATVRFSNVCKKFTVSLTKRDKEHGTAQGQATLEGAVYGVYRGEELVDTYKTDINGSFTTKAYVCGPDWSVREIEPSPGYLLDETVHAVGAEAKHFDVEHNAISLEVTEQVVKGTVAIIKHVGDGSTQIETPEEGAAFAVYPVSAENYEAAAPEERDILVCDVNGFAQSKPLPYGQYVVEQTAGWDGAEWIAPFEVDITEEGKTYRYLINNSEFQAYLKIVKIDGESGLPIPYAGATFEIYDPDGKLVTMATTYPELAEHTQFVTNQDGWLITPEMLPYGEGYAIVEKKAPDGYTLNPDPVYFDVTPESVACEDGIVLVVAQKANMPQKGRILINKTGETFASVTEENGRYTPVFAETGLVGAEFEIRAAEDVHTPDGTFQYGAGEVVDTLVTNESGAAGSQALYLGRYEVWETKAPHGMVKATEPVLVELKYAGQEVSVTSVSVAVRNERQKVLVKLFKDLERDERFQLGSGDELLHVYFALYAAKGLTAADGSEVPQDGLIAVAGVQADGTLTFSADLPIGEYYVQEYAVGEQYLISSERYPVVFSYEGEDVALVEILVNDGDVILNRLIRGGIAGIKVNPNGEPLPEASFGLFKADCTAFTEETAILTAASGSDGSFRFDNVPYGVWLVRELGSPEGYVLSPEIHEVQITGDGQMIDLGQIENQPVPQAPQTGDNSSPGFWLGLAGISLGGVIALIIMKIKRDKGDE